LRFLADYGLAVIEVDRPDRYARRRNGKSDPLDAESAARAVQSGRAAGTPELVALHCGGDRGANSALWRIALVRMHCHQPAKDCVARRTAGGRTKKEILRCLKRYIAREIFPRLLSSLPTSVGGHRR
jgi:hypothetical protein